MTPLERLQRSVLEHMDEMSNEGSTYKDHDKIRREVEDAGTSEVIIDILRGGFGWEQEEIVEELLHAIDGVD